MEDQEQLTKLKIKELHHTPRGTQLIKVLVQLRIAVYKKEKQYEVNKKRKEKHDKIIEYLEYSNNAKTLKEKIQDVLRQLLITTICYDFIPKQEIVDRNNVIQKKYCFAIQIDKRLTGWLRANGHTYTNMPKFDVNYFNPELIQHHEWTDIQYKYFRKIYNHFFEYVNRKSKTVENLIPKEEPQQ